MRKYKKIKGRMGHKHMDQYKLQKSLKRRGERQ